MNPTLIYNDLILSGEIKEDNSQRLLLSKLDLLHFSIESRISCIGRLKSFLGLGYRLKGLYIYGTFGCGKSLLLRCFYDSLSTDKKYYGHFSSFMSLIKSGLHIDSSHIDSSDYFSSRLEAVLEELFSGVRVYCLDECIIRDVGDAMIFGRVFEVILGLGGVILCTSNFSGNDFGPRGVNKDIFDDYKSYFFANTEEYDMSSTVDYRDIISGSAVRYYSPLVRGEERLHLALDNLLDCRALEDYRLDLGGGRELIFSYVDGIGLISYDILFLGKYGYDDFEKLSRLCKVLFLSGMREILSDDTSTAKRFIMLIDCLYDSGVRLYMSSEVEVSCLYVGDGEVGFEFKRALSRLEEIQSR